MECNSVRSFVDILGFRSFYTTQSNLDLSTWNRFCARLNCAFGRFYANKTREGLYFQQSEKICSRAKDNNWQSTTGNIVNVVNAEVRIRDFRGVQDETHKCSTGAKVNKKSEWPTTLYINIYIPPTQRTTLYIVTPYHCKVFVVRVFSTYDSTDYLINLPKQQLRYSKLC